MPKDAVEGPQPDEDEKERVDRELIELLNELRVALPGVQVLFAFLLTVPFSQRFDEITSPQRSAYLVAFLSAALGVALLITPSAYHRIHFRKGDKLRMLFTSNRLVLVGMGFVAISMTGVVFVITDIMFGVPAASALTAAIAGWFIWFWYGFPIRRRIQQERENR
jgi:hypothetical protein